MRYDLTDFEWSVVEPLLVRDRGGVKPKRNRQVLNGIFWVLRTGAPRRDLPKRYDPYTTCYNRFNRWRKADIWDRLMDAITKASCRCQGQREGLGHHDCRAPGPQ
jgi:transposase